MFSEREQIILRGKLIVLGDAQCGKSFLIHRFISGNQLSTSSYQMTSSPKLSVKSVSLSQANAVVDLFIFDIPGHKAFGNTLKDNCQGASSFFIVYDVTNNDALNSIGNWLKLAQQHSLKASSKSVSPLIGVLIANKCDASDLKRKITSQQGHEIAQSLNLKYFECEQMTDISAPFQYVAESLHEEYLAHIKHLSTS